MRRVEFGQTQSAEPANSEDESQKKRSQMQASIQYTKNRESATAKNILGETWFVEATMLSTLLY
jgi:hypothetical protein